MLDFTRSFVTWTTHPWQPHPYYRWHGGFVGELGDVYRVRMQVDSTMEILVPSGSPVTHYLGYPCRTEITIATEQFFMLPSGEWRAVFTREHRVPIARGPSDVPETGGRSPWSGQHSDLDFRPVTLSGAERLLDGHAVNEATQAGAVINGQTTYRDEIDRAGRPDRVPDSLDESAPGLGEVSTLLRAGDPARHGDLGR